MLFNNKKNESGQALITATIALLVLLVFGVLAVDAGMLYTQRRHMQNAADAGALAGARELCDRWDQAPNVRTAAALAVANNYGGPLNGAPQVDSAVAGNKVIVTSTITATSFLAQLIGVPSSPVHAVAKAACGSSTAACGIFPIAYDMDSYYDIACDTYFYVWADDNADIDNNLCLNCDCSAAFLGRRVIGPGNRGWLRFSPPAAPYPSTCGANCGANALACWIQNDWPGKVAIGQCIPGNPGVKASDLHAVDNYRINSTVRILLFDPDQPAGACTAANTVGDCPGTGYQVTDFGCVTIVEVNNKLTLNPLKDAPNPKYKCPKNDKVILVYKPCTCPLSSCGATDGSDPVLSGVRAVSLVD